MSNQDSYIENAQAKLDELKAEIDRFEADIEKLSANVEIKRREAMKVVRQKQADVEDRLQNLRDMDEPARSEVSEGFKAAWKDLTQTFEEVREHYS